MACRNGAAYLEEQLASIAGQRDVDWRLIAGDDRSIDATRAILLAFAAEWPDRVEVVQGPGAGAAAHFLALLERAEPGAVAFADQDDVWMPGKLREALDALAAVTEPGLFVARVALWDGKGAGRAVAVPGNPGVKGAAALSRALVQNIGPGHAMVLNARAAEALRQLAAAGARPVWHDWWAYQVVLGLGGRVISGCEVQVLYRQHAANLVGRAAGLAGGLRKLRRAFSGRARDEFAAQLAALDLGRAMLTDEARALVAGVRALPDRGPGRALGFWRLGLRRSGTFGRIGLALAAGLGAI